MQPYCPLIAVALLFASTALADDWPRFRGPNGTGISPSIGIANEWTSSDYAWSVELPGVGHSSPVVVGNQVYVTSGDRASGNLFFEAYDVASGNRRWRKVVRLSDYEMHASNNFASASPAADAEQVYISFYSPGEVTVIAYSHAGDEQWRTGLGAFGSPHGFAASPVVVGDVVCLQGDNADGGYLVALDARTGGEKWRAVRPAGKESYATPAVVQLPSGGRAIVVTSMTGGIRALDPATGNQLWQQANALPARTVSSPIVAGNLVMAACGGGGNGKQLYAVRATDDGQAEHAFTLSKNVPYVPTGIVCGDLLFLWHERGTITCIDLETQQPLWTKRVGGKYFGSPVCLGDRLLAVSMDGEAVMLAAGRKYELLGRTDLGEATQATPAVADGRLLLRTESKLMCLAD